MIRRSFLASATALLTLPMMRLFGADKPVRASQLMERFGERIKVSGRAVIVDANMGGFDFDGCTFRVELPDEHHYCVMFNLFRNCRGLESFCHHPRITTSGNVFSGPCSIECVPA